MDNPPASHAADSANSREPPAKRVRFDDQPEPSFEPAMEEIDPKGDLVVAVGTNPTKYMRISAKHMTNISNMYEVLLDSDFAESQSPHDTLETAIKLPEDDPDGTRIMFQLAHLQIQDPKSIECEILPQILVVCDKYGCLERFRYLLREVWSRWLRRHGLGKSKPNGQASNGVLDAGVIVDAVCMARLFEDKKMFRESMKLLFKHVNKEEIESMSAFSMLAMMPGGFEKGMKASWEAAVKGAQEWLYDSLKEWIDGLADGDPICSRNERRLGVAIHTIKKHKLDQGEEEADQTVRFVDKEREVSEILKELSRKDAAIPTGHGTRSRPCKPCAENYQPGTFLLKPWDEYIGSRGCACYDCFAEGQYEADPEERGCEHD